MGQTHLLPVDGPAHSSGEIRSLPECTYDHDTGQLHVEYQSCGQATNSKRLHLLCKGAEGVTAYNTVDPFDLLGRPTVEFCKDYERGNERNIDDAQQTVGPEDEG